MHASPDALHLKGGVLDGHRQHTGGPPRPIADLQGRPERTWPVEDARVTGIADLQEAPPA